MPRQSRESRSLCLTSRWKQRPRSACSPPSWGHGWAHRAAPQPCANTSKKSWLHWLGLCSVLLHLLCISLTLADAFSLTAITSSCSRTTWGRTGARSYVKTWWVQGPHLHTGQSPGLLQHQRWVSEVLSQKWAKCKPGLRASTRDT